MQAPASSDIEELSAFGHRADLCARLIDHGRYYLKPTARLPYSKRNSIADILIPQHHMQTTTHTWHTSLAQIHVMLPKPSPAPLIRIGGQADGSYLLPDDLHGIKACFSPGVSNRKDFEDELCDRFAIACHMCDYSSDKARLRTPLKPTQTFRKKWLETQSGPDRISLTDWVNETHPDAKEDLLLQMDIEGAEFRTLLNTPENILRRFRIIVLELHRLRACKDPNEFSRELGPLLSLLDKHFVCVHAHPNNCCGEFILDDSGLNMPQVCEFTFLRRDRWRNRPKDGLYQPLIPHPLDIAANVPGKPPIFLNEKWLPSGRRPNESTIKMLEDQVRYLSRKVVEKSVHAEHEFQAVVEDLHASACYIASLVPSASTRPHAHEFVDLASGRPFRLSSKHEACPRVRSVTRIDPFFFHTGYGRHQSITVDLGSPRRLFELLIVNRRDTCQRRARCLFYCAHDEPEANHRSSLPVNIPPAFLGKGNPSSLTDLKGAQARYVTVFSPEQTFLHFSALEVRGL